MTKKSETTRFEISFRHNDAQALAASLVTECQFIRDNDTITISEKASTFVDIRARWNSLMRGLIASEQALNATKGD